MEQALGWRFMVILLALTLGGIGFLATIMALSVMALRLPYVLLVALGIGLGLGGFVVWYAQRG